MASGSPDPDEITRIGRDLAASLQIRYLAGTTDEAVAYATRDRAEMLRQLLDEAPRLAERLRTVQAELAEAREELQQRRESAPAPAPAPRRPAPADAGEAGLELGAMLSAPFRVTPEHVRAAKADPLMALAVQVARALGEDAKEVERARLIAMAFAAARGDMDAFWSARTSRTGAAKEAETKKKTGRAKK